MHAAWQTLAARLPSPLLPRSGGTALPLPTQDGFLLVGGYTEDTTTIPPVRAPTAETLLVTVGRGVSRLESATPSPPPRLASAGATVGTTAWLLGGWDPGTKGDGGVILDDVWSVQVGGENGGGGGGERAVGLERGGPPLAWTPHPSLALPGGPASRHCAASLPDGRLVVYTHRCGESVLVLHAGAAAGDPPPAAPPRWERVVVKADPQAGFPPARGLASLVALPTPPGATTSSLLLFGGAPKRGGMDNDLWRLVLLPDGGGGGGRWERVGPPEKGSGSWPAPRCSHVAAVLPGKNGANGMVVWGGSYYGEGGGLVARGDAWWWDEGEGAWRELETRGGGGDAPPLPRNAAAGCAVVGEGRAGVLVSGGWDPFRVTYGDSAVLWAGGTAGVKK